MKAYVNLKTVSERPLEELTKLNMQAADFVEHVKEWIHRLKITDRDRNEENDKSWIKFRSQLQGWDPISETNFRMLELHNAIRESDKQLLIAIKKETYYLWSDLVKNNGATVVNSKISGSEWNRVKRELKILSNGGSYFQLEKTEDTEIWFSSGVYSLKIYGIGLDFWGLMNELL